MDVEKARKILEDYEAEYNHDFSSHIFKGIIVLRKYGATDIHAHAEHEQLYYGGFEEITEKMTEEDFLKLIKLGWYELDDRWAIGV